MMLRVLPHFAGFIGPALLLVGAFLGGWWTLLPVAFIFGFLPVLDDRVGRHDENPAGSSRGPRFLWDAPLWLWVPAQLALIAFVLRRVSGGQAGWLETVGLTISLGVVNGSMGIVIAHELMHRTGRFPRALAEILMASVSYAHFCVEHVYGHHRNVATPRDPATSRHGETIFAFLVRSIAGGAVSAWRLEADRVARTKTPVWRLHNARLRMPIVTALMYAAVVAAFGLPGAALFFAQGFVAVVLLEITNYLEHYGLERREIGPGRYETVGPQHSWNSSHLVSNAYLFNLARHSDHHFLASRPYEMLRHWDDTVAPQLPAGYPAMLLAALVPPLWFRIMDPRVAAWRQTEAARAATVPRS